MHAQWRQRSTENSSSISSQALASCEVVHWLFSKYKSVRHNYYFIQVLEAQVLNLVSSLHTRSNENIRGAHKTALKFSFPLEEQNGRFTEEHLSFGKTTRRTRQKLLKVPSEGNSQKTEPFKETSLTSIMCVCFYLSVNTGFTFSSY